MQKNIKSEINHILISALIGIVVGNISLLVLLSEYIGGKSVMLSIIISAIIGVGIGFVARAVFKFVAKKFNENRILAYVVEGLSVFGITILIIYLFGQRESKYLILSGVLASVLAWIFTFIKVKEFKKLNEKLKNFQSKE